MADRDPSKHEHSEISEIPNEPVQRLRLPFITELHRSRNRSIFRIRNQNNNRSFSFSNSTQALALESPLHNRRSIASTDTVAQSIDEYGAGVIKVGLLTKTSKGRSSGKESSVSRPGLTRQRRFRLTEEALEYFHYFSQVKVKRSFPLTSVETVEYDETKDPTKFQLVFSNSIESLQAETTEEASDWVEKIIEACAKWHPSSPMEESYCESSQAANLKPEEEEVASKATQLPDPVLAKDEQSTHKAEPDPPVSKYRWSAISNSQYRYSNRFSNPVVLERSGTLDVTTLEDNQRKSYRESTTSATTSVAGGDLNRNFSMIKYPRHVLGLPNEKLFKMDTENMQILWRRNQHSRFHQTRSLSLHKVVEVREGQRTTMFDKFPYEQVENQSFSLVYLHEDKRYAYLTSLDLICDHPQNYDLWINELKSKVKSEQQSFTHPRLSSQENDITDTTILWLKQLWSCKSDKGELSEGAAIRLARKLNPFLSEKNAKGIIRCAHHYQLESSYGLSLNFHAFILAFNLVNNFTNSRLYSIFIEYAKASPHLGMTSQEFEEFLIQECNWQRRLCSKVVLQKLMRSHDSWHIVYKKYNAKYKSADFIASNQLLSYAGFISFLRSKDNPVIDPEHETVYQDMTQPLSHYFINSSHNTYLEGDQLRGKSSTDAYIRALLQGCRCVEIDCWDDTLNVTSLEEREPIIYHGYTLTSKLPFREVIHTIKDYAFTSSKYPLVISIENHCNDNHQTRMAKIFRAIFDEMLPEEDLVELEGRERLPSPQELQGKIILKGSYEAVKSGHDAVARRITKQDLHKPTVSLTRVANTLPTRLDRTGSLPDSSLRRHIINQESHQESTLERSKSLKVIRRKVQETEQGQDDQELAYEETVGDLKSLIIYAKATSIKPWNWKKQKATTVTQMFSFGEPKAVELCTKDKRDMLACTERQLVRTYPKATRVESTNYNPLPMWRSGIQMVALNYQYPDVCMHLNQGFFRLNGGCGYVLKPAVMRREDPGGGSTPFDPEMQTPHPDIPPIDLEIELISGQRLCPWKKKCTHTAINIHTFGIPHDCEYIQATHDSVLWPQWEKGKHCLKKTLYMPELCLVHFRVEADRKFFGQNCIPVISLQPGIKFIPLRTPGGELIPGSGLFVKIKKTAAVDCNTAEESESDMSGRSLRGKMNRQNALDHQDGEDHAKEEKERCSDERRTKVAEEEPQAGPKQQLVKSQAEDAGTADSTLINSPPQPRNAW